MKTSSGHALVAMSPEVLGVTHRLRSFLFDNVYMNPRVKAEWSRAHHVVSELYRYYREHPDEMPPAFQPGDDAALDQSVCDYIAGMTDQYALTTFEAIFIPKMWSM